MRFKLKTKKNIQLACDFKSSNSHSLSLWQCLAVYLLQFKTIYINIKWTYLIN